MCRASRWRGCKSVLPAETSSTDDVLSKPDPVSVSVAVLPAADSAGATVVSVTGSPDADRVNVLADGTDTE